MKKGCEDVSPVVSAQDDLLVVGEVRVGDRRTIGFAAVARLLLLLLPILADLRRHSFLHPVIARDLAQLPFNESADMGLEALEPGP